MKKLLLLLLVSAPVWAGTVYTKGNQFPSSCGSSGLVLSANGDCTTSWTTAPPPTGLLVSTNTWSASQSFNGITKFGFDSLEVTTGGEFFSPGDAIGFLNHSSKYMMRVDNVNNCFSDHIANCTALEIGRVADGFSGSLQSFISSQWAVPFQRLQIETERFLISPEPYNTSVFGAYMTMIRNDSSYDVSHNNNVVLGVQGSSGQAVDLIQTMDSAGNPFVNETLSGGLSFTSKTKSALQAYTPVYAGETFYCSDCSVDALVVSTGTARGAFARVSARTTAIN